MAGVSNRLSAGVFVVLLLFSTTSSLLLPTSQSDEFSTFNPEWVRFEVREDVYHDAKGIMDDRPDDGWCLPLLVNAACHACRFSRTDRTEFLSLYAAFLFLELFFEHFVRGSYESERFVAQDLPPTPFPLSHVWAVRRFCMMYRDEARRFGPGVVHPH